MEKIDKGFEQEILRMPTKDKDKLLLRLLKRHPPELDKLRFQLLESNDHTERHEELRKQILELLADGQDTPGWLLMDLRSLSGDIKRYSQTTKDRYGEIELTLLALKTAIEANEHMLRANPKRADTFALYFVKRLHDTELKISKLHDDYASDFYADIEYLMAFMLNYPPAAIAAYNLGFIDLALYKASEAIIPTNANKPPRKRPVRKPA